MADITRFIDAVVKLYSGTDCASVKHILDAGCGSCPELLPLSDLFTHAHFTLIDYDCALLNQVDHTSVSNRVRLECKDIISVVTKIKTSIDLAVVRHPDTAKHPRVWQLNFEHLAKLIGHNALIIVSTYEIQEAMFVASLAEELSLMVIPGTPYVATPVALEGNDRYIQAYRKSKLT